VNGAPPDSVARAQLLAAAREIRSRLMHQCPYQASGNPAWDADMEARLAEKVEEARRLLEGFRASRAGLMALDALLPGWVAVDVADLLPEPLWRAFLSNDQGEWVQWLAQQGVPQEKAASLVASEFAAAGRRRAEAGAQP